MPPATPMKKTDAPATANPSATVADVEKRKIEKRAKFVELVNKRLAKALQMIANVGNLANLANYQFDAADAALIEKALDDATEATMERYKNALAGKKVAAPTNTTFIK